MSIVSKRRGKCNPCFMLLSYYFDVWADNESSVRKWKPNVLDFEYLWLDMCRRLPKESLEKSVAIMRRIWGKRNEFIFKEKFSSPCKLVKYAVTGLDYFHWQTRGRVKGRIRVN